MNKPMTAAILTVLVSASAVTASVAGTCQNPVNGSYLVIVKEVTSLRSAPAFVASEYFEVARLNHIGVVHVQATRRGAEELARRADVIAVEQDCADWQPLGNPDDEQVVPWGIDAVKAREVWGVTRGAGVTVAVLDTGVDTTHEDLSVTGGKNFTGGSETSYGDVFGHGSHVSGTIAALDNAVGVLGVSPDVSLIMGKVLSDTGSGQTSWIAGGIDWAVSQGADVLSMSLGSSTSSTTLQAACDRAWAAGVLVVAASGNDGASSVGYPAAYSSVIAVGAVDSSNALASFSNYGSAQELVAPGVDVLSSVPMNSSAAASGTVAATGASLSLFPMTYSGKATVTGTLYNCGLATTASDCPAGVSGNIALVQRGSVSFSQKATSAQTAGAAAVVIYNNADGDFYGTLGEDSGWGPVVSSSKAQGEALLALGNAAVTIAVTPSSYSTYAGTSMATPHVAGVAALVRAANPGLSNQQVRDLLTSTATDLGTAGRDNSFGYGLVDAAAAVDAAN